MLVGSSGTEAWASRRFAAALLTAGTFYSSKDGLVFYDVHDPSRTVVLELDHEEYRRLVVEVEDPPAIVQLLRDAGVPVTS